MCTVLLPPGVNPIEANKYHIISVSNNTSKNEVFETQLTE